MEDEILQQKATRSKGGDQSKGTAYALIVLFVLSLGTGIYTALNAPAPAPIQYSGESPFDAFMGELGQTSKKGDAVAVVKVYGPIVMASSEGFPGFEVSGRNSTLRRLQKYKDDDSIKGVLMHVNSPGGTVAASEEIHEAVEDLIAAGKPVYVSMGDLAASGGYFVAAPATKIYANSGTLTGSIGVYIGNLNLTGLSDKIGVDQTIIKGGEYKDILSPWRDMREDERQILQTTVDGIYNQFLTVVSEGRGIDMAELRTFADGRLFSGEEAKSYGLVDELGSYEDALLALWQDELGMEGDPNIRSRISDDPFAEFVRLLETRVLGPAEPQTLERFIVGDPMLARTPVTLMYPGLFK